MKTELISLEGKKIKEIDLPKVFSTKIREDILKKAFEIEKIEVPYSPNYKAGKKHSASGIIRHLRKVWKSGYGRGMSRIPRKVMWRRGTQFYWIGAEISSARGGRRAHPPKVVSRIGEKRMNKKELEIAYKSAIASTCIKDKITKRYSSLSEVNLKLPIVIESKIEGIKTKDLDISLKKILGDLYSLAIPKKSIRAGKGKSRNRKYKKTRGVLLLTGKDEVLKTKAIESKKIDEILISDLYPARRLVIYTEKAINDLEKKQ